MPRDCGAMNALIGGVKFVLINLKDKSDSLIKKRNLFLGLQADKISIFFKDTI
jgi:hypothetical protein